MLSGPPHADEGTFRVRASHARRAGVLEALQLVWRAPRSVEQRPDPVHDARPKHLRLLQQPQTLGLLRVQFFPHEKHLVSASAVRTAVEKCVPVIIAFVKNWVSKLMGQNSTKYIKSGEIKKLKIILLNLGVDWKMRVRDPFVGLTGVIIFAFFAVLVFVFIAFVVFVSVFAVCVGTQDVSVQGPQRGGPRPHTRNDRGFVEPLLRRRGGGYGQSARR